ncbi:MAG: NAD(+)/NADH kinase [Bacteroidales bacterium]|nr:NAD(+)/NADH kinase [Bacteroidales bacterium]MDD6809534.1 NAD(+)/NADH kinase [Bacteroidales bacterium]
MKPAYYIKNPAIASEEALLRLLAELEEGGIPAHRVANRTELSALQPDMLLAVGGDGTFLSAAELVADSGIPVLGVNLGRLGFLSENTPSDAARAVLEGRWSVEDRPVLSIDCPAVPRNIWPFAFNEMTLHRNGAAMLGVDVCVDGNRLPTYWADGLLVATSSGSTAYSLSVGGPIVMPQARVLIISPIAPHNLNVRPIIVPDSSEITLSVQSRDPSAVLTMDNRRVELSPGTAISVKVAQFSLKRVRLEKSDFIHALTGKLFWGEDMRNGSESQ